eukprot:653205-Prymnesium_polylepis.1
MIEITVRFTHAPREGRGWRWRGQWYPSALWKEAMADLERLAQSATTPPEERQQRWQTAVRSRLEDHERQVQKQRHAEMHALRARAVKCYRTMHRAAPGTPEYTKAAALTERAEARLEHMKLTRAREREDVQRLRGWYKGPQGARDLFDTVRSNPTGGTSIDKLQVDDGSGGTRQVTSHDDVMAACTEHFDATFNLHARADAAASPEERALHAERRGAARQRIFQNVRDHVA